MRGLSRLEEDELKIKFYKEFIETNKNSDLYNRDPAGFEHDRNMYVERKLMERKLEREKEQEAAEKKDGKK